MSQLILSSDSALYRTFSELVKRADLVCFAGLPGVGKSLLLGQMALMAVEAGRPVTLLQWDVARQPFESDKYPLADGVTHPMVIRAAGVWLRDALLDWAAKPRDSRDSDDMLIGEAPLVGGRLMEIARPAADPAEALLTEGRTQFLIPTPSRGVRALIESRREETIAQPQHKNEAHDASPNVLRASWQDLYRVAVRLGLAGARAGGAPYSPDVYAAVYRHLLQYRNARVLPLHQVLQPSASVYANIERLPNLQATAAQAAAIIARLEAQTTSDEIAAAADNWFRL